jgi:serine/threonine-protein kinase
LLVCIAPPPVPVPDVTGDTPATAAAAIQSAGLTVGSTSLALSCDVPVGTIIRTSPQADDVVAPGTTVNLTKSRGPLRNCP